MFNDFLLIITFLATVFGLEVLIQNSVTDSIRFCQYYSQVVVHALHEKYINKEIMVIYEKIIGPKKSKVIIMNGY